MVFLTCFLKLSILSLQRSFTASPEGRVVVLSSLELMLVEGLRSDLVAVDGEGTASMMTGWRCLTSGAAY